MAGVTQEALYREIELALSWSEAELPQAERTKHVHALHPYLGKYVPQLVEFFLERHFVPGSCVYDPFAGSGTTLVEAALHGCDAIGTDVSAFNCLLATVKTARHDLPALTRDLTALLDAPPAPDAGASAWLRTWFAPRALAELLGYRDAAAALDADARAVAHVILSRSARSARLTSHFDLDFPREPVREPYWCHKHRRECRPVEEAAKFLRRYTLDTLRRLAGYAALEPAGTAVALHADARAADLPRVADGVITSPPYPGLIGYHEQHRYAYELLGLEDRTPAEIGGAAAGRSRRALAAYVEDTAAVFRNAARFLPPGAPVVIVVNDAQDLYPGILDRAHLVLEERLTRHVNRRTGRRAGEFFEDVLVCAAGTAA